MIVLRGRVLQLAAVLTVAALSGCARNAPPAPLVSGERSPSAGAFRAAEPPPVPPAVARPGAVIVQSGETLYSIARRYDVPVRSLIETNQLEPPYRMNAGRRLTLPQVRKHIVQPGETLYGISRKFGVDTSTLARTNGLGPPYRVWVGEELALPAPVETAGAAPVIQATAPAPAYAAPAAPAPTYGAPAAPAPAAVASASPPRESPFRPPAATPPPSLARSETPSQAPPPPPPPAAAPPAPAEKLAALPPPVPTPTPGGARTFIWPVHGRIIGHYGNGEGGTHNDGINIAAAAGTPVLAADSGTVAYAGNELRGYGNLVLIKHANGWLTAYAHNAVLLVKRGELVRRGQPIARVGATGAVNQPQLHFEIRHGTRALDPGDYLPPEDATASRTP